MPPLTQIVRIYEPLSTRDLFDPETADLTFAEVREKLVAFQLYSFESGVFPHIIREYLYRCECDQWTTDRFRDWDYAKRRVIKDIEAHAFNHKVMLIKDYRKVDR